MNAERFQQHVMTTNEDFIRQASLSAMHGLINLRLMPEDAEQRFTAVSSRVDLFEDSQNDRRHHEEIT